MFKQPSLVRLKDGFLRCYVSIIVYDLAYTSGVPCSVFALAPLSPPAVVQIDGPPSPTHQELSAAVPLSHPHRHPNHIPSPLSFHFNPIPPQPTTPRSCLFRPPAVEVTPAHCHPTYHPHPHPPPPGAVLLCVAIRRGLLRRRPGARRAAGVRSGWVVVGETCVLAQGALGGSCPTWNSASLRWRRPRCWRTQRVVVVLLLICGMCIKGHVLGSWWILG